jgi:hypothetical protein
MGNGEGVEEEEEGREMTQMRDQNGIGINRGECQVDGNSESMGTFAKC